MSLFKSKATVHVDGVTIRRINQNKFLDVIIDDKIHRKPHIKPKDNKTVRHIFVLIKIK